MFRTRMIGCLTFVVVLAGAFGTTQAQDTGVIKGKAIFKGNADDAKFKRAELDTSKDANCAKSKAKIGDWKIVLNKKTSPVTVRNVLVSVKDGLGGRKFEPSKEPLKLDQIGCEYVPHVFGIMAGQPLKIRNSDPTNHNIHFQPKVNAEKNFSQPKQDMETEEKFVVEAPFKIKCDVHPWMGAYMAVFDHPFFSTTNEEGTFEIKNLPPGKYTIEAWHEEWGPQTATVEVKSGETKEHDFTFEPK